MTFLQEEKDQILKAAEGGDINTIQSLLSSGVDVTGVVDVVSMSVATACMYTKIFTSIQTH